MKKFTEFSDELCNQIFDLQIDEPSLIQNNPNIIEDIKRKYLQNIPLVDQIMFNTMYETKKSTKQVILDVQDRTKNIDKFFKKPEEPQRQLEQQPKEQQQQQNPFLLAEQISRSMNYKPILSQEIKDKATKEFNEMVNEITGEQSQKINLFDDDDDDDINNNYSTSYNSSSNRTSGTSGTYAYSAQELARKYSRPGDWHHGVLMRPMGTRKQRLMIRAKKEVQNYMSRKYRVR